MGSTFEMLLHESERTWKSKSEKRGREKFPSLSLPKAMRRERGYLIMRSVMSEKYSRLTSLLVAVLVLGACGEVDTKWQEQVDLSEGKLILVERTAKGRSDREIGGPGGWEPTEMTLTIQDNSTAIKSPPTWRSKYVPILLDYDVKSVTWSIVSTFYYCSEWSELGKPASPYLEFQSVKGQKWQLVTLENRLIERQANLLVGPRTGGESAVVFLDEKNRRNRRASDMYKKVISEWKGNC